MATRQYEIRKTEAKYSIHGVDTYRIVYKAKPTKMERSIGISESWLLASDKLFYTLAEAEAELKKINGGD